MRHSSTVHFLFALFISATTLNAAAQGLYVPPTFDGDPGKSGRLRANSPAWVADTEGDLAQQVRFVSEGGPLTVYALTNSTLSFVRAVRDTSEATPDTLYRIDMKVSGEMARSRDPEATDTIPGRNNYYFPQTGTGGALDVAATSRVLYKDVHPDMDLQLYGSATGTRMAFVAKPGSDPSGLVLTFLGADSLKVDLDGLLKVYLKGWEMKLMPAVVYQVDSSNNVIPLNWTPNYNVFNGLLSVFFDLGEYDEELPVVFEVGAPAMGGDPPMPPPARNLDWCTFHGDMSGGSAFECVDTDPDGNVYFCGFTWAENFPVNPGWQAFDPFQPDFMGEGCAVAGRFNAGTRQPQWTTFYGGSVTESNDEAQTGAHKLSVYKGSLQGHQYVFVTGSTNCENFDEEAVENTIFENAEMETYQGGRMRAWIGAFHKVTGYRDWATTHGESGANTWYEDGLCVDVDEHGKLAFGGKLYNWDGGSTNFHVVTPTGAWSRAEGSGFFIVFDEDYQIDWASCFAPVSEVTGVEDMRIVKPSNGDHPVLWIVGNTLNTGSPTGLDVVPPPSGFHQAAPGGDIDIFLARLGIVPGHYDLEFSTYWGGDGADVTWGMEAFDDEIWVTGFTTTSVLSATLAPDPGGNAFHETVDLSDQPGKADGLILRFSTVPWDLTYGTRYGGLDKDIFLDVATDGNGRVFFTGESRSHDGVADSDMDANLFYQPPFGNAPYRDAMLLGMRTAPDYGIFWRTIIGGLYSDRGWGLAATPDELFLCGAANSSRYDGFPLVEWDPGTPEDFYQTESGSGYGEDPTDYYSWQTMMDFQWWLPSPDSECGPFIASFFIGTGVGWEDTPSMAETGMRVWPDGAGNWNVELPGRGTEAWQVSATNGLGQVVRTASWKGTRGYVHYMDLASGPYILSAVNAQGERKTIKVLRP